MLVAVVCAAFYLSPPILIRGFFVAFEADRTYMARAIDLASRGWGQTSPNPMVGAVVVAKGEIVGEGFHARVGGPHAEVVALKEAGTKARGATVYINLEPCCHTGQTGPCSRALIAAKVVRVVFASIDPDPRVSGCGKRQLKKAGIVVEQGVLKAEAEQLNEIYHSWHRRRRPFVILKWAQTLDGRIATRSGDSQWISSPPALKFAHHLRAGVDAIMVGMGTVRHDDPALTVRLVKGTNPYRVIVTGSANLPQACGLLRNNADGKTVIASSAAMVDKLAGARRNAQLSYWKIKRVRSGRLDLHDLVTKAGDFGLRSLLIEGGSMLATSFLKAKLVDKIITVVGPMILGQGLDAVGDLGLRRLSDSIKLERMAGQTVGPDFIITGYPRWS